MNEAKTPSSPAEAVAWMWQLQCAELKKAQPPTMPHLTDDGTAIAAAILCQPHAAMMAGDALTQAATQIAEAMDGGNIIRPDFNGGTA